MAGIVIRALAIGLRVGLRTGVQQPEAPRVPPPRPRRHLHDTVTAICVIDAGQARPQGDVNARSCSI